MICYFVDADQKLTLINNFNVIALKYNIQTSSESAIMLSVIQDAVSLN